MEAWVAIDGIICKESEAFLPLSNRAFQYGDSLFESMVAYQGTLLRGTLHWKRLSEGMAVLGYQAIWNWQDLQTQIHTLLHKQQLLQGYARVRCQVWRATGGLYTPQQRQCHLLIQASPLVPSAPQKRYAGIAKATLLNETPPLSSLKTGSALPYIMAGIERQTQGWDEILLLNSNQQLVEAGASNLFWIKEGLIYTPSLQSGCLAGVTRHFLLNYWSEKGIKVQEGLYSLSELWDASHVFTSNATGLHHLTSIDGHDFATWPLLNDLYCLLFHTTIHL